MAGGGVSIRRLSKSYRLTEVIKDIHLDIPAGEVFGLIGPNGAGKTTTLKCIVGLIRDYQGEILIDGQSALGSDTVNHIGYMPQSPRFVAWRNVHRALRIFGRLNGMDLEILESRIDEVLEMLDIIDFKSKPVTQLSGGTLQKLGFAQSILHSPSILVLDEPMSSLDPQSRRQIRGIIQNLRERGTTVVFSSHILSDVQDIADRVGIINYGQITHLGKMEDIKREMRTTRLIDLDLSVDPKIDLASIPGVNSVDVTGQTSYRIRVTDGQDTDVVIDDIIWKVMNSGGSVRSVFPVTKSLEDVYMQHLGGRPL
ncbi:MAG: ABC transporter ATP-binding protein [Candidatus Methanomethylophilaceae archaeon]|nr:ABC transporter ATP-binding protein [Candidatus Methanomethylophilaceae archaeon]